VQEVLAGTHVGGADPRIGAVIGGCRIEAEIGRGSMGVVYRATDLRLGRVVAIKVIAPELARDAGFRERFEQESQIAASIEHPNVVPVYRSDEEYGELYITMRHVDGTDLRTLLFRNGPLHPRRAAQIVVQIGAALDAAHALGLVHRDVKPGNVMVAQLHGRDHAYLTDFGLTKKLASGAGLTRTGEWVGTVDYVAPEQIEGRTVDARADVYALGCILYQSLTGRVPYDRESDVAKMYAHLNEPPPEVTQISPGVPVEFNAVVARAMAKRPADRYGSAGELAAAALDAAERGVIPQTETGAPAPPAVPPLDLRTTQYAAVRPEPVAAPVPESVAAPAPESIVVPPPESVAAPAPELLDATVYSPPASSPPPTRRRRGRPLLAALAALAALGALAGGVLASGLLDDQVEKPRKNKSTSQTTGQNTGTTQTEAETDPGGETSSEEGGETSKVDWAPWGGTWKTSFGTMTLIQDDDKVWGTYKYGKSVKGSVIAEVRGQKLVGRWAESKPARGGRFQWKMAADSKSFQGVYRQSGFTNWHVWNGVR
jgi:serine/threonine protein kinase